jgi:hypothetical protein
MTEQYLKKEINLNQSVDAEMCVYLTNKFDFGYLRNQRDLFHLIQDCGETEIILTEKVKIYGEDNEDEEKLFVLTNESVYLLSGSFFQFASLEYLEKISMKVLPDGKYQIYFDTPTEFDMHIIMPPESAVLALNIIKNDLLESIECQIVNFNPF